MKYFKNISESKTEDIVYLLLLFLYNYVAILDDSLLRLTPVIRVLKWSISIAGILLFVYRNRGIPSAKKLIFASVVLISFFIAAKATGRTYLVLYAVLIIAAEGCKPEKTVKTWLLSTVIALITILILCGTGVLTDHLYVYPSGRAGHCLGFSFYSSFPFLVFCCSIAYIYLKKDQVRVWHYALVGLANLLMYHLTTLNLTFYLTFIFIILDYSLVRMKKLDLKKKPIVVLSSLLFPLGVLATFFIMVKYNPEAAGWTKLNTALHSRPGLSHQAYLRYPLSFFGNRINMVGHSAIRKEVPGAYFYIDSGFAYSLLAYGLVFTCVAVALYSVMYVYSCRTDDRHLFAWLTCVLIFSLMNNIWVDVCYNPALLISFTASMGTEIKQKTARLRIALAAVEAAGLAAIAVWLVPWFKALGNTAVGGKPLAALLEAAFLGVFLLGLAVLLERLLQKLLLHQQPGKRELAYTVVLLLCCTCGILALNRQVYCLTVRNAEKLEVERNAIEAVQQENCRLLVDGPAEVYRRIFGGVGRSLYHGNNLTVESNAAYITDVENDFQELIGKGYLYTEISDEHALYTNSPDAAAALQAAGYHLTGYYSHNCTVNVDSPEALCLPGLVYRATYDLCFVQNSGRPVPAPDTAVATLTVLVQSDGAPLATRDVLFSEFGEDGTCSAVLDFSADTTDRVEFFVKDGTDAGDVLVKAIHYCQYPSYDIHFTCDDSGRRISETYYDLSGNPAILPDGTHAREYGYDNTGNTTFIRYYDVEGNPLMLAAGYAALTRTYKEGRLTEEAFFGTAGESVNCGDGYAVEQREYDGSGNLVAQRFLDAEARLVNAYPGYAEMRCTYDADNRLVRKEFFSTDGKPALRAAGYSAWEQEYDSEGNLARRRYLDADGHPALRTDGFSEALWGKASDSPVRNLELIDLSGRSVSLEGVNLAQDLEGDGWSAWISPQYNANNSTYNIGSMNLGEKAEGDVFTCQLEIEFSGVTASEGNAFSFRTQGSQDGEWTAGNVWNGRLVYLPTAPEDGIYQYTVTNTVSGPMAEVSTFDIGFRCDNWASGAFRVRNVKIEKGGEASAWSPGL